MLKITCSETIKEFSANGQNSSFISRITHEAFFQEKTIPPKTKLAGLSGNPQKSKASPIAPENSIHKIHIDCSDDNGGWIWAGAGSGHDCIKDPTTGKPARRR
jgi:hypothetical protein